MNQLWIGRYFHFIKLIFQLIKLSFIDIKYKIINHNFNLNDAMYKRCNYGQRDTDGPR
jgi:hypothetical protein